MSDTSLNVDEIKWSNLKLLSWNIDGLAEKAAERARSVSAVIVKENPHIIHCQEVTVESYSVLMQILSANGYKVSIPKEDFTSGCHYFTLTFVKSNIDIVEARRIDFVDQARSHQGRDMNELKIRLEGVEVLLINSHLESCKESTKVRTAQLVRYHEDRDIPPTPSFIIVIF